ncbi:MAG: hypothetical protein GXP04_01390 [Alphaproteobacteria bacterium]|nr:hypothetical protein [Marinicaulis sp.]NOX93775.1 hypothetical protein [Alphaproteobacteria bacterium]
MIWLAAHMWILLIAAFGTGLGIGWWIWGAQTKKMNSSLGDAPMGSLNSDTTSKTGDL